MRNKDSAGYRGTLQDSPNRCCVLSFICAVNIAQNCNKSLSIQLQKLQNRAAGIFTSSSYDANAVDLFVRLGCQKLSL